MDRSSLLVDRPKEHGASIEELRQAMEAEGRSFSRWSNAPGDVYAAHRHDYHKVILVEEGSITFNLLEMDVSIQLEAGDRLQLPAHTLHAAVVGPRGVACLEAHIQ